MADITDRQDIIRLVNAFYEKVKGDGLLHPVFAHVDWPAHLPVMYNFWSSILFGDRSYDGSPFQKHMHLAIGAEHFEQWLKLFNQTVDGFFEGPSADEIKDRAKSIAGVFQYKLDQESGGVKG
jgi:hemoglobin